MLDISCPSCGAPGRVPNDKINTRLICKKCLRPFHLTDRGRAVPGDPPQTGVTSLAAVLGPDDIDHTKEVDEVFSRLPRTLTRVGLVLGVILAIFALYRFTRTPSVEDRSDAAARALVKNDLETIRSLALKGTVDDTLKWFDALHPRCEKLRENLEGRNLAVEIQVKNEDRQTRTCEVLALLTTKEDLTRKGAALPDATITTSAVESLEVPLYWTYRGWRGWRLDGKRTLEAFSNAP